MPVLWRDRLACIRTPGFAERIGHGEPEIFHDRTDLRDRRCAFALSHFRDLLLQRFALAKKFFVFRHR
ncbi:hypothetical protein ASF45_27900 [Pseudorhodoferax sp. Leaf265]|nr:hypothetical protein ASF45_27900 [Pseudorhodoferax sp. Leaf265]